MLSLDIFLMSGICQEEIEKIKEKSNALIPCSFLLSLDIAKAHYQKMSMLWQVREDMETLKNFQNKFDWQVHLDDILSYPYEALVLTNSTQTIEWVDKGFSKMTGYTPDFAIGQTPGFLQGKKTSQFSRKSFHQQLQHGNIFTNIILNYRKNREEYLCEIKIFPIRNSSKQVTHYLALEREIL